MNTLHLYNKWDLNNNKTRNTLNWRRYILKSDDDQFSLLFHDKIIISKTSISTTPNQQSHFIQSFDRAYSNVSFYLFIFLCEREIDSTFLSSIKKIIIIFLMRQ